MNSTLQPEGITIRCLRMRGKSTDPLHDQLRLSNILNSSGVRPRALPQSAVLCIRSLKDPLPGTLRLDVSHRMSSAEWENAATVSIGHMAEKASRPILGPMQPNVEAVLFADGAEFLACLAIDLLDGALVTKWWWKSIFRSDDISRSAVNAWLDAPEHVPAALQHLTSHGRVVPFLHSLGDNDVRASLQSLVQTFGMNELRGMLDKSAIMDRDDRHLPTDGTRPETFSSRSEDRSRPLLPETRLNAPWEDWAPEATGIGLEVDRQVLLGVGLMLQRAPAAVRSRSFAHEVSAWYRASLSSQGDSADEAPLRAESATRGPESETGRMTSGGERAEEARSTASLPMPGRGMPEVRRRMRAAFPPGQLPSHLLEPESETSRASISRNKLQSGDSDSLPSAVRSQRLAENASPLPSVNDLQLPSLFEERIETELGGLFYLINLALYLNLYSDFTRPLEPGVSLPIWDFISLFGHRLLADRSPDDPVWGLLARLAVRAEHAPPGARFEPPDEWRMPADWLGSFASHSAWTWSVDRERLRVRHPEGFCILDVQIRGDRRKQLRREIGVYAKGADFKLRREKGELTKEPPPLERWIDWLLPFISARLQRALGLDRDEDLPPVLFSHRARVEVRAARLDVYLALAHLPISIRLAGLDRDPGWVPAAGRYVAFHYQ